MGMLYVLILIACYTQACLSLYVAKGTPCSSQCNSTGGSWWTDLVCSDEDFSTTLKGQTLQSCLGCTIDSLYINSSYSDGNSDQFWTLYHMKYVQQYCLIDNTTPHIAAVNACTSACSPLTDVLTSLWINKHPFVAQYNYCTLDSSAYLSNAAACSTCLQAQEGSVIIGNFVETMLNACDDKPLASNGGLIAPARNLFESAVIPISSSTRTSSTARPSSTTATSKATTTSSEGSATSVPTSLSTDTAEPAGASESAASQPGLSTGAAAGIGAVAAVLVLAAIAGVAIYLLRRRRQANGSELRPLAMELDQNSQPPGYPDAKHGNYYVYEKSVDGQIYEAPNGSANHLIELPASRP